MIDIISYTRHEDTRARCLQLDRFEYDSVFVLFDAFQNLVAIVLVLCHGSQDVL